MALTTRTGKTLTDAELDELARRAEAGFDLATWVPRRGRPSLEAGATEHSPRVSVRVPASLRDRAAERAAHEGRTISEVLRSLLEAYAGSDSTDASHTAAVKPGS